MRIQSPSSRSRLFGQVAIAAILSGLATGCSADATRVTSPLFSGATPNQRAIIEQSSQQSYGSPASGSQGYSDYTGSVGRATKEPVRKWSLPPIRGKSVPTVSADAPIKADRVASAPVTTTSGGWTATGGTVIPVRDGDTLYGLARRYGVPADELMRVNGISDPSQVRPGQNITIPTYVYSRNVPVSAPDSGHSGRIAKMESDAAPLPPAKPGSSRYSSARLPDVTTTASIPSRSATATATHVVQPGETLSGIANQFGLSSRDLMAMNNIDDANHIRVGQRLIVPGSGGMQPYPVAQAPRYSAADQITTGSIPSTRTAAVPVPMRKPAVPASYDYTASITPDRRQMTASSAVPTPVARPAHAVPTAYTPPQPAPQLPVQTASLEPQMAIESEAAAQPGTYRWPVRGRILSEFGPRPDGQHNDGINVAVPEGTSVKAAEDGIVVYAGSELKGYGNLVLIKHTDDWVTAYAHN
ncbi:MAG: LysM peptidoglycan-binding domain-containing protein, partial [Hyphomicrobiales bacterium]|nr:LysM peptidoglycan-binding domain-containing protein [Hyphomicrobiales bacterium]